MLHCNYLCIGPPELFYRADYLIPENAGDVVCNCLPVCLQFSLPMPQGGRDAITKNPILREDQLPQKVLHPKSKKSSKVSALAFLFVHIEKYYQNEVMRIHAQQTVDDFMNTTKKVYVILWYYIICGLLSSMHSHVCRCYKLFSTCYDL